MMVSRAGRMEWYCRGVVYKKDSRRTVTWARFLHLISRMIRITPGDSYTMVQHLSLQRSKAQSTRVATSFPFFIFGTLVPDKNGLIPSVVMNDMYPKK